MDLKIKNMPKIELHMHLDGSVPIQTLCNLSHLNESEVMNKINGNFTNLSDYLKSFDFILQYMQTKEELEQISYDVACNLKKQNVIYAEIRFAPILHTRKGLSYDEIIDAILNGIKKCTGIKINLILCLMRGESYFNNLMTIYSAKKYLNHGVGGIDLAGDETNYSFDLYKSLFEVALENNIPVTIHAGETLQDDLYKVTSFTKRIGHGIKAYDNPKIIKEIIKNNILLEICPKSNVDTKNVSCYEKHPIQSFINSGIKVSINTDNDTVSNISLTDEYLNLSKYFHLTLNDFKKINLDTIDYCFISEDEKEKLREKIKNYH